MNETINPFEHLYQYPSQNIDILEKNARDYPFSSLACFLLLCHYKETNHPGFEKLSKKTALHFQNTNWLQFLLDQIPGQEIVPAIKNNGFAKEVKNGSEINSGEATQIFNDPDGGSAASYSPESDLLSPESIETFQKTPENLALQNIQEGNTDAPGYSGPSNAEVAFEPLHTVDYFASQGIKITEEPISNDKLGSQVKSFTAWLKSMKKLHPSHLQEQDVVLEKLIQNSAEESNVNTEIYTEAMAEVLVKQDKKEKAIEMYHQLSLLNPSKSAYFAAKIDNIKTS